MTLETAGVYTARRQDHDGETDVGMDIAASIAFGEMLKRYRVAAGLSQEALAERAGMSARGISDLERGVRRAPYRDTVIRLAAALELDDAEQVALEQAVRRPRRTAPRRLPLDVVDHETLPPAARFAGSTLIAERGAYASQAGETVNGDGYPALPQELPVGGFLGALPTTPMVGRDGELAQILEAADTVARGAGRLLLLAGEAGAGKTRLAQETSLVLGDRGFLLAVGSCFESRQSVPYYPFLDVLTALYGMALPALRSEVTKRWPHLGRLLPEAGIAISPLSDSQHDQEWLFRNIAAFIRSTAQERSVAILLDDLHWADQSSLDLLQHLARQTRANRILLLGTYRDVEVRRGHPLDFALTDLRRQALLEVIAVSRLNRKGTAALIAASLGQQQISDELVGLVHHHTDGNAFFTQEVLRALIDRGDVFQRGSGWERRKVEEIEVPESIRSVISQCLSRLPSVSQGVLREASVLGQRFGFDDLRATLSQSEDVVEEALDVGIAAGLVREMGRDSYGFNHALTQQAMYSELSRRRKRRLHLAAGEALERLPEDDREKRVSELAWHFLEGDDSERALRYSLLAGDQAKEVFAWREAERHYCTALNLARKIENQSRLAEASFKLGMALWSTGHADKALPRLEEAAALYASLDDPVMEGRARQITIYVFGVKQLPERRAEALEQVEQLLDRIVGCPPSRDQIHFYHFQTRIYSTGFGNSRASLVMAERGIEVARLLEDEAWLAHMELSQAEALGMAGRVHEAIAVAERVLPSAEAMGSLHMLAEALEQAAEFSMLAGKFEQSRVYREREAEVKEQQGDTFEHAVALANQAQLAVYRGEWHAARQYAEDALARGEEMDYAAIARFAQAWLGHLALLQGDWEVGQGLLERAATNPAGTVQIHRYIQRDLAQLDILLGHPEVARGRLERLIEGIEPNDNDRTFLLPILAWALLGAGDIERAADIAAEAVERARRQEYVVALVDALRIQGMVLARQGHEAEAAQVFEEDVRLAQGMPYPFAQGQALYEWGVMGQRHGERAAARDRLEAALAIFRRLGAEPSIERVERELAEVGLSSTR